MKLVMNAKYGGNEQKQQDVNANLHTHPAAYTCAPAMILVHPISCRPFSDRAIDFSWCFQTVELVPRTSIDFGNFSQLYLEDILYATQNRSIGTLPKV